MQMLREIQVRLRRSHYTVEEEEDKVADADRDQGKVEEESLYSRGGGGQICRC